MSVSFDGVRLTYVGETGAFFLYVWQTNDQMYDAARNGCADLSGAEDALAECVGYLEGMAKLMEVCA